MKSEVEKLFEGIKGDEPVDIEIKPEVVPEKDEDPEKVPESVKNRQHRRLQERLQAEREANIILNERLRAESEARQNVTKVLPVDARLSRIFGTDTPEKIELAKHFTEILSETRGQARKEAVEELRAEQQRSEQAEAEEVASYETKIESGLEAIEDEYGVDMSTDKARKEFLDFVTKIAPKDADGSPIELPDLVGAYEIFKDINKAPKQNSRRTEIASRSMQSSGQTDLKQEQVSDEEKWLVQNGIIKPRKR